jgi:hypothetical protein
VVDLDFYDVVKIDEIVKIQDQPQKSAKGAKVRLNNQGFVSALFVPFCG